MRAGSVMALSCSFSTHTERLSPQSQIWGCTFLICKELLSAQPPVQVEKKALWHGVTVMEGGRSGEHAREKQEGQNTSV